VLISATFWRGTPFLALRHSIERETLLISEEILREFSVAAVRLASRWSMPGGQTIAAVAAELRTSAEAVQPGAVPESLTLRDPADAHVVAAAIAGRADYLVTGDRDLLAIRLELGMSIVTPAEFLALASS
jgi:putative PIN family toxin of toxin-antitoxin system